MDGLLYPSKTMVLSDMILLCFVEFFSIYFCEVMSSHQACTVLGQFPNGHFPDGQFPEGQFPDRHFPDGHFPERTFPRTDISPNGHFPERTFPRTDISQTDISPTDNLQGLQMLGLCLLSAQK